ncbi:NAD-dependent epimerase/dehydratase family protein [Shouchella hunanensis]|uniref:NAD-dependent epimerase/dehydratase family protein n=1 Tax=Shouchella hunanensis TaxID=766894 RepID=A0ABY7W506_9BACI|nr:NAD-dependent epimerase/dehydratase family protein [Shouchella hunanensis]WDF04042.1 NAD-dependent epimerase/dehydratase family protein [Shouchella hunanensis]
MNQLTVIGGLGFIGSHVCAKFLDEGWEVVAVDHMVEKTQEKQMIEMSMGRNAHFTFIHKNVNEFRPLSDNATYVYVADNEKKEEVLAFASGLHQHDRLLYLSTTRKGETRTTMEEEIKALASSTPFSLIILRSPQAYGLHSNLSFSYIDEQINQGNRDLLYINDLVDYVYAAIEKENGTYSVIGSDEENEDFLPFSPKWSLDEGRRAYKEAEKKWIRQNDLK